VVLVKHRTLVVALVRGGWARGWGLFRRRRNGARVCEVRARRFRLSVSASSRAPPLVLFCPLPYLPLSPSRRPYLSRCAPLPAEGWGLLRSTTHISCRLAYAYVACIHGGVVPPCRREAVPIEGPSTSPSLLGFPATLPPDQRISYSDISPVLI